MAFTLFKKDQKPIPGRPSKRGPATLVGSNRHTKIALPAAAERKPHPKDIERAQARETAAKIDQIESEMARGIGATAVGQAPAAAGVQKAPAVASALAASSRDAPDRSGSGSGSAKADDADEFESSTNVFLGRARAIEITDLGAGAVADEAAVLFAQGQIAPAEAALRQGIANNEFGDSPRVGWHLLLELLNQRDDRAAFEQTAKQYASRFQQPAPAWYPYPPIDARAEMRDEDDPVVRLPSVIDAGVVPALDSLKAKAAHHRALALDAGPVTAIDAVGAEMLLRVLLAFRRAAHSLTIYGAPALVAALRTAVRSGRRTPSDACWLLRLELLRIAGQSSAFDDVALEYGLTYEVSPPAWERATPNLSLATGPAPQPQVAEATDGGLRWNGVIEGDGAPLLAEIAERAKANQEIEVDCSQLRRIEVATASALMTLLLRLKQAGTSVRLTGLNPMVMALLRMLGIGEIAELHARP